MAFNTEPKPTAKAKRTKKSTAVSITAQELMTSPEYAEDYKAFLYIQKNKKRVEQFEKIFKGALLKEMEENGLLEIQKGNCNIKYNPPKTRFIVDNEALKNDGIYEDYLKESHTSASVTISYVEN